MTQYENVHILDHPLIRHKVAIIRDKNTSTKQFREVISEIATLMAYEAFKEVPTQQITVETPLETVEQTVVKENSIAIVPILRAGLGMVDGILTLFPAAKVGHIGMYRNEETLEPQEYYCKLPQGIEDKVVMLVDPMLATGGSAIDAITLLKNADANTSNSLPLSAHPKESKKFTPLIPTLKFTSPRLTANSTRTATFCRGWGMRVIVSSAQNNALNSD